MDRAKRDFVGRLEGTGNASRPRTNALDRRVAGRLLEALGRPPLRLVLWDGEEVAAGAEPPVGRVRIGDRRALHKLWFDPDLAFGDLYRDGRVTFEGDLAESLVTVFRAMQRGAGPGVATRLSSWLLRFGRSHGPAASRQSVHHHYDLGNAFYELWLDEEHMQYTCAYYPRPGMSLAQAQEAKLDLVCRKLRLRAGDSVVEAGCGWGGLALFMARRYGVTVRAFNLSHEQVAYARGRAAREGLAGRVEFVEDDYRNITGRYDAFVSVGMLEHVGLGHYARLGEVIDRSLSPDGRGLIHCIGRNRPDALNPWVERRIFPGAYPPTLGQITRVLEPHAFSVLDVENLRLHYAETLEHWLARFERNAFHVARMFDDRFVRAWRLYLASSRAAFITGSLQLFQVVFSRPLVNELPASRAYLHAGETAGRGGDDGSL